MSWLITNRKEAELSGVDLDNHYLLLAITPAYVAERYNDFIDLDSSEPPASQDPDEEPDSPWDSLTPARRQEILDQAEAFCDKHFREIDDHLTNIFNRPSNL